MLAQGQELEALRAALPYQRVIYCGDGANDLCPALALSSSDVVLARQVREKRRRSSVRCFVCGLDCMCPALAELTLRRPGLSIRRPNQGVLRFSTCILSDSEVKVN